MALVCLSVSIASYFKIKGVTEKTRRITAEVCGVVAVIAAFMNLVYGGQAGEVQSWSLWVFGAGVLVLVSPFLIWSFRSDYQKRNEGGNTMRFSKRCVKIVTVSA